MIWTLAVNCTPILDCSKDDEKTVAETASDEMVMGAVQALCEFSLLGNQQNHADQSLTTLEDTLKQFYKNNGVLHEKKMSKSANAKVDEQLARESQLLWEQKIHRICAAMEVQVYRAEKVTTTKQREFQVCLNRAPQAVTTWSDANQQTAKEWQEHEIH